MQALAEYLSAPEHWKQAAALCLACPLMAVLAAFAVGHALTGPR